MTREYLVVYEKGAANWSAVSPDVPGCGTMGNAIEDTRDNMREALEIYLRETVKAHEPMPEAISTSVDFEQFDPGHETKHYVVEWLAVSPPQSLAPEGATQAA